MDENSTCHDQQVDTNTILYALFKKPATKDEFEDLTEVAGESFDYETGPGEKKAINADLD